MRPLFAALLLLVPLLLVPTPGAAQAAADPVVIAVLDSGIRPDHRSFAPGQVVAWYDFTNDAPRPVAAWDPLVSVPYDDQGHGTSVASMAAGVPFGAITRSHAPGAQLAVAKVLTASNTASWSDISAAIRWAVDVAGADVISLSIYRYLPGSGGPVRWSGAEQELLDSLAYARSKGVLPVVLAGNGANNAGVPIPSWLVPPAASTHALVVGGQDPFLATMRPQGSYDPEVVANYTVYAACHYSAICLTGTSGTSFSTPLVAGAAARLLAAGRDVGLALGPDDLEDILKRHARDGPLPPAVEGYGFVGAPEVAQAEARIRSGAAHPAPDPITDAYMVAVQSRTRGLWHDLG